MKTMRLKGPMPSIGFFHGGRQVVFHVGVAQSVDDAFAAELLGKNADKLTVEKAAPYCIPVFEEVPSEPRSAKASGGREEVSG